MVHWYRHGLILRRLQVQSLLREIFFITIIWHNYAFDHHKKLWVCSKTYIFFIKWKTVNFFCHARESNRGPVQTLLLTREIFPSIWGKKFWEIFPSIWLCTWSLPHIWGKISPNFLSVWLSSDICKIDIKHNINSFTFQALWW